MASPVGHALVGLGIAAAVGQATGTPSSPALWLGAIVASGIPDLDFIGTIFGLPSRRIHRHATHSLLVLAGLILVIARAWPLMFGDVEPGLGLAWAAALLSHPLLDLAGTGPAAAAGGFGVALLWPLSSRRWFLRQPVLRTAQLTACRSAEEFCKAIAPEACCLGPASIILVLLSHLF
jgi:membrane-bound metal-dependent hydrolase YbcI (DUF457 family)